MFVHLLRFKTLMVSLLHHSISFHLPSNRNLFTNRHHHRHHRPPSLFQLQTRRQTTSITNCIEKNASSFLSNSKQDQRPQRTLFPGGYKRPEIKIPNVVLQLDPEEVLDGGDRVFDVVDEAVSGLVGVVVLNSGEGSVRKLYDAVWLLKTVIRDRAYLLISERVDIATAVNASGVVVSDQGLPAIVARNTIMDSKSDSVFLPLIGRKVQTSSAATNDSSFEGADFLIYGNGGGESIEELSISVINQINIPTFVTVDSVDKDKLFNEISYLLQSGASGLVVSLEGLKLLGNDHLNKIYSMQASNKRAETLRDGLELEMANGFSGEKVFTGFAKLEDREAELIETERSLLLEAIDLIRRASLLMEEVSLLSDFVSHLASSIESPSPDPLIKESNIITSPISEKYFWSNLRYRIDTLLENQKDQSVGYGEERGNRSKRLKEDSLLLLRGFDSVASSLSQLSNNLDNALQGAKDLARPPTLSDVLHSSLEQAKRNQNSSKDEEEKEDDDDQNLESNKRGLKRKLDPEEVSDENQKAFGKLNRAKNIAVSMAKKAGFLAREVKSMKSDLCFMQERCSILEEENRRLRDGFVKGIPPEEDDLVRLQLEALLAEKSRLANDNANLTRENQCLRQLVEYHQLTSRQDEEEEVVEEDYEDVIRGVCLDFSSPPPPPPPPRMPENLVRDGVSEQPQIMRDL